MNRFVFHVTMITMLLLSFSPAQSRSLENTAPAEKTQQDRVADTEALIKEKYPDAIRTSSGLMYVVLKQGEGETPKRGSLIEVHYTGRLLDGTKFDSSVDRGQPFHFALGSGRVIRGWEEAFLDMKKGEKRILIVPPHLGYGSVGMGNIPPNATLVFEVELLDFL